MTAIMNFHISLTERLKQIKFLGFLVPLFFFARHPDGQQMLYRRQTALFNCRPTVECNLLWLSNLVAILFYNS